MLGVARSLTESLDLAMLADGDQTFEINELQKLKPRSFPSVPRLLFTGDTAYALHLDAV